MNRSLERRSLEDFNHFCSAFDTKAIIAAVDEDGQVNGFEKEVYALAVMRAVNNGAFGSDAKVTQAAISALWARGYNHGFNANSFNAVFMEFFNGW